MTQVQGKKKMLEKRRRRGTEDERLLSQPAAEEEPFTNTDPWRVLRILGEFVEGFEAMADVGPAVTIFGSARTPATHPMYHQAVECARRLGEEGYAIITGGGPGIMEAGNQGARQAGADSIGLNIELPFEQHVNPYVDLSMNFRYFFARKMMFLKYASAFVIFPGGFGTMDEMFESLTLIQTGKVRNFPVVLFGRDYWEGLIGWLRDRMLEAGNICAGDLDLLLLTESVDETVDYILRARRESWRQEQEEGAREASRRAYGGPSTQAATGQVQ